MTLFYDLKRWFNKMEITRKGKVGVDVEPSKAELQKIDDWQIIEYFKPHEFSCKCGKCYGILGINFDLVLELEVLRKAYGLPIKVNSGYRCEDHVETKKNPTSSHHVGGNAVDISVKTSRERYMILDVIFKQDLFQRIGIGKDFLHLDIDKDKSPLVAWLY